MKIKVIEIKNFKRFTHLRIQDIPGSAKLVLLIGSNGSGKSCIFDSFDFLNKGGYKNINNTLEANEYYSKNKDAQPIVRVELFGNGILQKEGLDSWSGDVRLAERFIGRSSVRIVPRISNQANVAGIATDRDSPVYYIDHDTRFINDVFAYIQNINQALQEPVFSGERADTLKIFGEFINPLNSSLLKIFGGTPRTTIQIAQFKDATPNTPPQLIFKKGQSRIGYDLLSHGEKQVIILLLNFIVRRDYYKDTILFIDEMDCHLNTALQFSLLKEITEKWIPDNTQLWTASHALGFIDYAQRSSKAAIIDLDLHDFDEKIELTPTVKDNPDIYEIAIGKDILPSLFNQMNIFFVENTDRNLYASVNVAKTVFISDNNRNSVYHKVKSTQINGIVDRDFLTDADIELIRNEYPKLFILDYYSLENYLYHPDNLEEYHQSKGSSFDKEKYIKDLVKAKNEVKNQIMHKVALVRTSYPYFSEPDFNGKTIQKRFKSAEENFDQTGTIQSYFESDELEQFYKSLPMKDYCKQLSQRQHIPKTELAKTEWFRRQISDLLSK